MIARAPLSTENHQEGVLVLPLDVKLGVWQKHHL